MKTLYLSCFLLLVSCSPEYWPGATKDDHILVTHMPSDEGEQWQHQEIEHLKKVIIQYASELGSPLDLNKIPIIVRKSLPTNSGLNGTCNYDRTGEPRFIEIYSDVFDRRQVRNHLSSHLFVVLLHEIGHCYFFRNHESVMIEEPSVEIYMNGNYFSRVAASVMALAPSYYFPKAMEKYYVAEILGLQRAESFSELKQWVRFQLYRFY